MSIYIGQTDYDGDIEHMIHEINEIISEIGGSDGRVGVSEL